MDNDGSSSNMEDLDMYNLGLDTPNEGSKVSLRNTTDCINITIECDSLSFQIVQLKRIFESF